MKYFKSRLGIIVAGIVLASFLTSCMNCIEGEGEFRTLSSKVDPFTEFDLNIGADVAIHQGESYEVKIRAQENLLEVIRAKVRGDGLVIKSSQCIRSGDGIKIDITVPTLSSIQLNGSGSIKTSSAIKTEELDIGINGSGDVSVDVKAEEVEASINGSGEMIINGFTEKVEIEINGSGDVRALGLVSKDAEVVIRGSGDIYLNAQNSLESEILGSGDVIYTGNPSIESSVKGSGNISKKD